MLRFTRYVSCALGLVLFTVSCASRPTACNETSFASFWSEFQRAVANENVAEIQRRAQFPLATRGPMDSDPVIEHSAAEFPALWSALLDQDPGLQLEPETLRDYIARHDTAPADAVNASGVQARVADLTFTCRAGAWTLSTAYTSE